MLAVNAKFHSYPLQLGKDSAAISRAVVTTLRLFYGLKEVLLLQPANLTALDD